MGWIFWDKGQNLTMSDAIAAHKLGFDLTIIEKDPVYYEQAKKRLIEFQRQQVLF